MEAFYITTMSLRGETTKQSRISSNKRDCRIHSHPSTSSEFE